MASLSLGRFVRVLGALALLEASCTDPILPVGEAVPSDAAGCRGLCGDAAKRATDAKPDTSGRAPPDARSPSDAKANEDVNFGQTVDAGGAAPLFACKLGSGWSWCNPSPTGVSMNAVWASSDTDVWAVGASGTVEHLNASGWSVLQTPTTLDLNSVWGSTSADIWAVGASPQSIETSVPESVILHYDGLSWTVSTLVSGASLASVWGSASTDVWVVGTAVPGGATALHWSGSAWSTIPLAAGEASALYGVGGIAGDAGAPDGGSAGVVWAVGVLGTDLPEILTWDGTAWGTEYDDNGVTAPTLLPLSIWTAPGDAWVATTGLPLHEDTAAWQPVMLPGTLTVGPTAFGGTGESDVWGTLGPSMLHWNGSSWDPTYAVEGLALTGNQPLALTSVWSISPSDVWAVGQGGALVHFDGTTWSPVSLMPELLAAWASGADDAWAVGAAGTALHWNGAAWSPTATGTPEPLVSVWGVSSSEVWALAATSDLLFWNGTDWSAAVVQPPTGDPLVAIGGTGASDLWLSNGANNMSDGTGNAGDSGASGAPTNEGTSFHWDGATWTKQLLPLGMGAQAGTGTWIRCLWANAVDDVWGAGYQSKMSPLAATQGVVMHWDGTEWTFVTTVLETGTTIATDYRTIWGSNSGDLWIAGDAAGGSAAAMIHYDGSTWSDATLPNLTGARGLWGTGPDDVWLWADFGDVDGESVVHWDGRSWSTSVTLPDAWSYGNWITGTGTKDVWAVGSGGMILHHS